MIGQELDLETLRNHIGSILSGVDIRITDGSLESKYEKPEKEQK